MKVRPSSTAIESVPSSGGYAFSSLVAGAGRAEEEDVEDGEAAGYG
jgi:hypothetical protein